jgi:uncharacterized protein (TIGR03435 family)
LYAYGLLNLAHWRPPFALLYNTQDFNYAKFRRIFGTRTNLFLNAAAFLAVAAPILAQSQTQNTHKYEYDVVSVKLNKSGSSMPGGISMDNGFTATNVALSTLLVGALGMVGKDRVLSMPDWFLSERYDINAKVEGPVYDALKKLTSDERASAQQQMLLSFFVDRCKLKFHSETRDLPVFTLTVAKGGPKFRESNPGEPPLGAVAVPDGHGGTGTLQVGEMGRFTSHGMPIATLVRILSTQAGRPVIDNTGLTGRYDFTWEFVSEINQVGGRLDPPTAPNAASTLFGSPDSPSIFTVIQEQLGLKLESGKGPVEVFVVDHIERPSGN